MEHVINLEIHLYEKGINKDEFREIADHRTVLLNITDQHEMERKYSELFLLAFVLVRALNTRASTSQAESIRYAQGELKSMG